MRRRIRKITFASFVLLHLSFLLLWWHSWSYATVLALPWPAHGFGIASEFGIITTNLRLTSIGRPETFRFRVTSPLYWQAGNQLVFFGYADPLAIDAFGWPTADRWCSEFVEGDPDGTKVVIFSSTNFPGARPMVGDTFLRIRFPQWPLALMTGLLVWPRLLFILLRRIRARDRLVAGLCPKCGYDMRANRRRCSECGYQCAADDEPPPAAKTPAGQA
jgi:hypothetical protein